MKRHLIALGLLAGVVLSVSGEDLPARNLDFSQQGSDGKFTYWREKGGAARYTVANGVLTVKPVVPGGVKFLMQSPLELRSGGKYRIRYESRGDSGMKSTVYVEYRNRDKKLVGVNASLAAVSGEWQKHSFQFSMPEEFSGAYLVVMISPGVGTCEFRNLEMEFLGVTDFAALARMKAAEQCFPLQDGAPPWRRVGAASGTAEYADGVLKLCANAEKGMAFFLKKLDLKPGVMYEVSALVRQKSGKYGIYVEYSDAAGVRRSVNGVIRPAPGENAAPAKFRVSLPDGAGNIVLVLAAGNSTEPAEFSNLELKEITSDADPTRAGSWRGGRLESDGGRVLLVLGDGGTASSPVRLKQGQYYRFGFDGATRKSKDLTGFASFRFRAADDEGVFFESDWDDVLTGHGSSKEFIFRAPRAGTARLELSCRGELAVSALRLEEILLAEASPAEWQQVFPAYRNTVFTDDRSDIAGNLHLKRPAVSAEITLSSAEKPEHFIVRRKSSGGTVILPDTAALPVGQYRLVITPFDAAGKALVPLSEAIRVAEVPTPVYRFNPRDNTFYRDGKPIHYHGFMHSYAPELAYLLGRCGVTTFSIVAGTPEDLLEQLDRAHANGFRLILDLRVGQFHQDKKDFLPDWERYIAYLLKPAVLAHPALAGYCSADEPAWCSFPKDQLAHVTEFIHKIDPSRPVWINEAPRGSIEVNRRIAALSDAFGVDIYPIPYPNGHSGLEDKTITAVGAYTRRCREAAGTGRPIWMVLQGFAWNDLHGKPNPVYPSAAECRFMALEAMANGANAVIYWGVNNIKNREFYLNMLQAISEVGLLSRLWQAGNTLKTPAAPGMTVFSGVVDGERYLVALNTTPETLDSQLDLTGLYELPEMTRPSQREFPPYTARVFGSAPRYPGDFAPRIARDPDKEKAAMALLDRMFAPKRPYRGKAAWIWYPGDAKTAVCSSTLSKDFDLSSLPARAVLLAAADDKAELTLNGHELGKAGGWRLMEQFDVTALLRPGRNRLEARVASQGAPPSGFLAELQLEYADGAKTVYHTDASWQAVKAEQPPCPAEVIAVYGGGPWGDKTEYRSPKEQ